MRSYISMSYISMALIFALGVGSLNAQVDDINQSYKGRVSDAAQSQKRINQYDDEIQIIAADYRATFAHWQSLRAYNAQMEKLIVAQEQEVISIRQQIEQVTTIDRTIFPFMERMIDALEMFVELDVPFQLEERKTRLAGLRDVMGRSDASPAEKFRKILEAYEIENEYGRTIEAYEGIIGEGESERNVNFLRFGRVTFLYQTLDEKESKVWDQETQKWVKLKGSFDSFIRKGLRVARQQVAPDLLVIPVRGVQK